jgi:TolB-like protein
MPFEDLSPGRDMSHMADGMTEDLIVALTRWKDFRVIDRASAISLAGTAQDIPSLAAQAGAGYVIEGSIRRLDDRLRITAQLVNGATGENIWADRYDDTGTDILAMQDAVIWRIAQTLTGDWGEVRSDTFRQTWAKGNASLIEYDYYQRGHFKFYQYTPESNREALAIWREGMTHYPNSGLLKVKLAWGLELCRIQNCGDPDVSEARILHLVETGMADPNLPPAGNRFGLWLLSSVYSYRGDRDRVVGLGDEVERIYPSDGYGLVVRSDDLIRVGAFARAEQTLSRAAVTLQSAPAWAPGAHGVLAAIAGKCAEAIPLLEARTIHAENVLVLASCLAQLGRADEAAQALDRLARRYDIHGPEDFAPWFAMNTTFQEATLPHLAMIGWPATEIASETEAR